MLSIKNPRILQNDYSCKKKNVMIIFYIFNGLDNIMKKDTSQNKFSDSKY